MKTQQTKTKLQSIAILFMLALISLSISSCKKDDEKPANEFSIGTKTKTIKSALFFYDKTADGKGRYDHELALITDNLVHDESKREINGTGSVIDLALFTTSINFEPGTYTFTGLEDSNPFEIWDETLYTDITITHNTAGDAEISGGIRYDLISATLKVTKSGDNYTIDMEGKAVITGSTDNLTVKAHYNGPVKQYAKD